MACFLLLTAPAEGHVTPTLPISHALVERGHQVAWITGKIFKVRVESTGATHYTLPETIDPGDMELYEFFPKLRELQGLKQIKWYLKQGFLDSCPIQIEAFNAVLDHFRADVLVGDPVMFGVYYKSELSRIPSAMISLLPLALPSRDTAPFGLGLLPGRGIIAEARNRFLNWLNDKVILRDVNAHANKIRRQLGLLPLRVPFMRTGYEFSTLVMQLTTPAFEYPRRNLPENVHFIGPMLPKCDPAFSPPAWWSDLSVNRPVILVTQGTVAMQAQDLYLPAIEALRNEDVLVLATIPVGEHALAVIPKNVRAEKFIPFAHLLPHVDVMVTNGGYGGAQLALAHGVPLVVAGATDDKMEVAARVEWSGAGINLRKQRPSPSSIKEAVRQALYNPTYRENARRIQSDFAQYNAPKRAVELLEALSTHKGKFAKEKSIDNVAN